MATLEDDDIAAYKKKMFEIHQFCTKSSEIEYEHCLKKNEFEQNGQWKCHVAKHHYLVFCNHHEKEKAGFYKKENLQ